MKAVIVLSRNKDGRRKKILQLVNRYGVLNFSQLREAFPNISDVTLRKDLQYLDDTHQAVRTHGGLKSIPSALNYFYRSNINLKQKQVIAKKAAELISPGDSVFISAGTTCAELARRLPDFPIRVCSDGVYTVSNISSLPNISVELLGGDVDLNIMRVEGIAALNSLDNKHFSIAFMGALCIHPDYGFAHNSAMTVAILEKVIERSDKVVLLADSTKFSSIFFPYSIPITETDIIVTEEVLPEEMAKRFTEKEIKIL